MQIYLLTSCHEIFIVSCKSKDAKEQNVLVTLLSFSAKKRTGNMMSSGQGEVCEKTGAQKLTWRASMVRIYKWS